MSTAGRPTYSAAVGRAKTSTIRTQLVSSKDQTAHTTLKYRQVGQSTTTEIKEKNFRTELETKEKKYASIGSSKDVWFSKEEEKADVQLLLTNEASNSNNNKEYNDDSDVSVSSTDSDSFASRYLYVFSLSPPFFKDSLINCLARKTRKTAVMMKTMTMKRCFKLN